VTAIDLNKADNVRAVDLPEIDLPSPGIDTVLDVLAERLNRGGLNVMTLDDPSTSPARTIAASAQALSLLLDSVRYAPIRRASLWSRLLFFCHRSILQSSIRSLCALLSSAHSLTVAPCPYLMASSEWSVDEIESLSKSSRFPIVIYRPNAALEAARHSGFDPLRWWYPPMKTDNRSSRDSK
jgi:hypothetical protein